LYLTVVDIAWLNQQVQRMAFGIDHRRVVMSTASVMRKPEDAHFMEIALRQAEVAATKGQTPCGAVILDRDGRLSGEGHNTVRADQDPTAHGEIVAIRDSWRRLGDRQLLRGGTVYTSIEPCLLCSFVITQFGFRRVVFAARGTDVPTYKPLLGVDLVGAAAWVNAQQDWTPLEVVGDFMRERSLKIIAAFPWT
jgi:tRNA(adenine34) deaminase